MRIRANFAEAAVVRPDDVDWSASPMPGVERKMLDRIGDEVARATSIVRYAPDSHFSPHAHDGGEEFLVLDGVFSDESGDFPAGAYVRNPIGTSHRPSSVPGCTIFVKLHQFALEDLEQKSILTQNEVFVPRRAGVSELPLHRFGTEEVDLVRLAPGAELSHPDLPGGLELLVLEGSLEDDRGAYPAGTWVRLPPGSTLDVRSRQGGLAYRKLGHLRLESEPTDPTA